MRKVKSDDESIRRNQVGDDKRRRPADPCLLGLSSLLDEWSSPQDEHAYAGLACADPPDRPLS